MRDIRLLVQFATVAETLSFSEAARRLQVAQPWLSARVRKLEEQLGATLFIRTTRQVRLTPDGRRLFNLVSPLAKLANDVDQQISAWREQVDERVRIGCPQLGGPDRGQADLISRFTAANPKIAVHIEPGMPDRHVDLIEAGALDLMLAVRTAPPRRWGWLRLHPLAFAIMLHPDDPLAGEKIVTTSMLSRRRVAMVTRMAAGRLHDALYGPMLAAGAIPVNVPELRRSLLQKSRDLVVTTIVPQPGDAMLRHGIIRKTIADAPPLWLMLLRSDHVPLSQAASQFWALASKISAQTDAVGDTASASADGCRP